MGQEDWWFSLQGALLWYHCNWVCSDANPLFRGYDGDGQMIGFSLFFSTDFSSLHFPRASLENGERKHIKNSYSCCELGSQKRTVKGYLHTHCKAFFFTLNISHLKPHTMLQLVRKMPNCFSDTNFCWLGFFSWKIKIGLLGVSSMIVSNATIVNERNWMPYPLWIVRINSPCTPIVPLASGHYNRWHCYIIIFFITVPEPGYFWDSAIKTYTCCWFPMELSSTNALQALGFLTSGTPYPW